MLSVKATDDDTDVACNECGGSDECGDTVENKCGQEVIWLSFVATFKLIRYLI